MTHYTFYTDPSKMIETFKADTFPMPVELLLKLFNRLQLDDPLRESILECIRDSKGDATAEGFKLNRENELIFDNVLFTEAIYRAKVKTYANSAKDRIKRLKKDLELLQSMGEGHLLASEGIGMIDDLQRINTGAPVDAEQAQLLSDINKTLLLK